MNLSERIPSLEVVSLKGKSVFPDDYLGKKIVLYFYPKDNTPG